MEGPAIAVLPYGHDLGPALARLPVSELLFPLGMPDRLRGKTVGEFSATDHLIIFPKTSAHFRLRRGTRARISLILGEPAVIHARHHTLLRWTHRRFFRILTFNQQLLDTVPNAVLFPLGTTWVPDWRDLDLTKSAMCSLIASAKRDTQGHKLRHAIADWVTESGQPVEIMGRGYTPFDRKSDGLARYRYTIVIENMPEQNYFSEKLVDAVLCDTVPIYWGCPNLEEFMDPAGIIRCGSEDDIRQAVLAMSEQDFDHRRPRLQALKPKLETYCDLERRAALAVQSCLA